MEGAPIQPTTIEKKEKTYSLRLEGDVLKLAFVGSAQNTEIVKDAVSEVNRLISLGELVAGKVIKLNGPASLPVAVAITNSVSGLFEVVAVFDPKLNGYVVSISNDPAIEVGSVLSA